MWLVPIILICFPIWHGILGAAHKGRSYLIAFPEHIAYFDPVPHQHAVFVLALDNNTEITISTNYSNGQYIKKVTLDAAETHQENLRDTIEMSRAEFNPKVVNIRSSKDIVAMSLSKRMDSSQFQVLQPDNALGSRFHIPLLTASGSNGSQLYFKDFQGSSGKVVILNPDMRNNLSLRFHGEDIMSNYTLEPFHAFQVHIKESQPVEVSAEHKVGVLLTHPCRNTSQCQCQMEQVQLTPTNTWATNFPIPTTFANETTGRLDLVVTSNERLHIGAQSVKDDVSSGLVSHYVNDFQGQCLRLSRQSSVLLIKPGNILELTPESSFSSCYFVPTPSKALVLVPHVKTGEVHVGESKLVANWTHADSCHYSWTELDILNNSQKVIWHPSAKIAVYFKTAAGKWSSAISLSTDPDPHGCLLARAAYSLTDQAGTWAKAVHTCQHNGGELVSINSMDTLQSLSESLQNPNQEREAWLGLRRRLLNGEWYWLNKQPMHFSKWGPGQPHGSQQNFCASMSLVSPNNFTWTPQSCCLNIKSVCFTPGRYFPLNAVTSFNLD